MNIENLARQAIEIIKNKWGLPKTGFIAGGSIANLVWELVSGNKAVVNDIDVFYFGGLTDKFEKRDKTTLFNFSNTETKYYEDYTGLCFTTRTKEFYSIVKAERDDMFNNIEYKSNTDDPTLIIRSFDINATRIGYHIEQDKVYWTKEFEEFLSSGRLKVCNLVTPCHTAVRIVKKSKELKASLDSFEIKLLQYSLSRGFQDKVKWRFKEKYKQMFEDHQDFLGKFFTLKRDKEVENYVALQYNEVVELYFLDVKIDKKSLHDSYDEFFSHSYTKITDSIFFDLNLGNIYKSTDFLFYMRYIYGNEKLRELWSKLYYFFISDDYIDKEVNREDIDLLSRFSSCAPNTIENLKGLKISEQINLIKTFLEKYKDDPIVAISILENVKLDKNIQLDDETALILELSVRKKIINDTRNKVGRILDGDSTFRNEII